MNSLNQINGKLNLKKRIKKAAEHGLDYTGVSIKNQDSAANYTIGIEVLNQTSGDSFNGGAHIS